MLLEADAQAPPLRHETFDVVVANHMLHHVADVPKALAEIERVLAPGGVFYASTFGVDNMQELTQLIAQFASRPRRRSVAVSTAFSVETGAQLLADCFERVRLHRYADALKVTEVEPLAEYVASGLVGAEDFDSWRVDFEKAVAQMIAQSGAVWISKETGLFEAWKAPVS